jgi:hypothetical protein
MKVSWGVVATLLGAVTGCSGMPGPEPPANRTAPAAAPPLVGVNARPAAAPVPRRSARSCDLPARGPRPNFDDGNGGGCPSSSCGSNSPVLNVFPYNGLHPDGCANQDGAALEKFSLQRGLSQCDHGGKSRLYLDLAATPHGFELVGKDEQDRVRCAGTALVGATFEVVGPSRATLRISQIGALEVKQLATAKAPAMLRTGYLITPADQPANSLCASRPAGAAEKATPILDNRSAGDGKLATIAADIAALYAIIIPGAVYDYGSQLIPASLSAGPSQTPGGGHRWFNIACAGDALAHTELSGLITQPIVDRKSAVDRQPALHMYTAQYCDGVSATSRGTQVRWLAKGVPSVVVRPDPGFGPIEARWDKDGATCVSHSRLWVSNKTISLPAQLVTLPAFADPKPPWAYPMTEAQFLAKVCAKPLEPCKDPAQPDTLTSYTVNHEK